MIAQAREYDDPPLGGPAWELHKRPAIWMARVRDQNRPDTSTGGKALGFYEVEREEIGDVLGAVLWERDKLSSETREIPGWHWAWPVVQETEEQEGQGSDVHEVGEKQGALRLRAVRTIDDTTGEWQADVRLARLRAQLPKLQSQEDAWPLPPAGLYGVVVGAVDESKQHELWQRTDPRLVLPWRGGREEHSEIVHDCSDPDKLDEQRRGRLAALMVVGGKVGGWQPALCAVGNDKGGNGAGYGAIVLKPDGGGGGQSTVPGTPTLPEYATALASYERNGLFHPGAADGDRHSLGTDGDGKAVNPLHLWHQFLVYRSKEKDGPFELLDQWEPGGGGPPKTAYRGWDARSKTWRITASGDIFPPPFEPPTEGPPQDGPPFTPPTDKIPPQPGRYPYELRVPSIYIDGQREEGQAEAGEPSDRRLGPADREAGDPTAIDGTTQRDRPIVGHLWGHTSWDAGTGRYEVDADTGTQTAQRWLDGRVPSGAHALCIGSATELPDAGYGYEGLPDGARRDSFRVHVLAAALSVGTDGDVTQALRPTALHLASDATNGGKLFMTDASSAEDASGEICVTGTLKPTSNGGALGDATHCWKLYMSALHMCEREMTTGAAFTDTDRVVVMTTGGETAQLPTGTAGRTITVIADTGAADVTVSGSATSATIDGNTTYTIVDGDNVTFYYSAIKGEWTILA